MEHAVLASRADFYLASWENVPIKEAIPVCSVVVMLIASIYSLYANLDISVSLIYFSCHGFLMGLFFARRSVSVKKQMFSSAPSFSDCAVPIFMGMNYKANPKDFYHLT